MKNQLLCTPCPYRILSCLSSFVTSQHTCPRLQQSAPRLKPSTHWSIVDGIVLLGGRIFLPSSSTLWPQVLAQANGVGHEGVQKTLQRLRASFATPRDNKLVRDYIRSCSVCQRNKTEHLHPAGLLQPLEVPKAVWADIAMDFVEGFPKVAGKSVILTVVDRFSKYAHFIARCHPYTAMTVAQAFFDQIVRLHGLPHSIVSDRDPVFTSNFWQELFRLLGSELRLSSTFHPQTDGQSEVTNRIITVYLRCLAGDRPKTWLRWLPWAEYCFHTSYQTALKTTPFQVVYGCEPPALIPFQPGSSRVVAVERQMQDRDIFLSEIRERLLQAQDHMKHAYDAHHRLLEFEVGDWVWLRLNQRAAATLRDAAPSKLAPKYFGPYEVLARIGSVSYRLRLPPKARLHDVFHVVFLKKFEGPPPVSIAPLHQLCAGVQCLFLTK